MLEKIRKFHNFLKSKIGKIYEWYRTNFVDEWVVLCYSFQQKWDLK